MRKMKKNRKKFQIPFKIKMISGVVLLSVIGLGGFFVSPAGRAVVSFVQQGCDAVRNRAHLVLDQVVVEGHARTTQADVNEALGLVQGMPVFDINPREAQEKLKALPWIKHVTVERHLPATLFIHIEERKPIAIWQNNKMYLALDEEGEPIRDNKRPEAGNLLLVVGTDAPAHTPELIRVLEEYRDIGVKVRSAVRVGARRWTLILNDVEDGLEIYLPETGMREALARLQNLNEENQILKRELKVIDLRLPDRLIVRTQKGGI